MIITMKQRGWFVEALDILERITINHNMAEDAEMVAETLQRASLLKKQLALTSTTGSEIALTTYQCADMKRLLKEAIMACWNYEFSQTTDVRRRAAKLLKKLEQN